MPQIDEDSVGPPADPLPAEHTQDASRAAVEMPTPTLHHDDVMRQDPGAPNPLSRGGTGSGAPRRSSPTGSRRWRWLSQRSSRKTARP